uniref:hypothetical protein n=1 Tax=Actinoplanes oblitus TaxID=3040509 RepID=UPI003898FC5A
MSSSRVGLSRNIAARRRAASSVSSAGPAWNGTGSWYGSCTGSWNVGSWNAGSWNTGSWNAGSWNTGSWNAGSWNTGSWNAGSWNTGSWSAAGSACDAGGVNGGTGGGA